MRRNVARVGSVIWLAAIALSLAAPGLQAKVRLLSPTPITAGSQISELEAVLLEDFTGDGRNDLLFLSRTSVGVRPGLESDRFGELVLTPASLPGSIEIVGAADFNRDGVLDLCIYGSSHAFGLMIGAGDGTFASPVYTTVESRPDALVTADFDGDGIQDVATLHAKDRIGVRLFRGDGNGGFRAPLPSYYFMASVGELSPRFNHRIRDTSVAGDFDGDGAIDIAVVGNDSLTLLWNTRQGAFYARRFANLQGTLSAGDLNGDGATDLVVRPFHEARPYTGSDAIPTYSFARGSRTLTKTALPEVRAVSNICVGDLDRNGKADVVLLSSELRTATVVGGRRVGGFAAPQTYFIGQDSDIAALGDVDSDGAADLLIGSSGYFNEAICWVPGNGDGSLRANRAIDLCAASTCGGQTAVMDVNGDGHLDFVVYRDDRFVVVPSKAAGVWGPAVTTETPSVPATSNSFVPAGDLDGDGREELILIRERTGTASGTWVVLHGRRDGSLRTGATINNLSASRFMWPKVVVGDLTGDGLPDLLESDGDVHPGTSGGRFGPGQPTAIRYLSSIGHQTLLADFTGDGKLDVLAREHDYSVFYRNLGDLQFEFGYLELNNGSRDPMSTSLITDLTDDGIAELIDLDTILQGSYIPSDERFAAGHWLSVSRGTTSSKFESEPSFHVDFPSVHGGMRTADFDGDGKLDLAVGANVLFGNGDGTFRASSSLAVTSTGPFFGYPPSRDTLSQVFGLAGLVAADDGSPDLLVGSADWSLYTVVQTISVDEEAHSPAEVTVVDYGQTTLEARVTSPTAWLATGAIQFEAGGAPRVLALLDDDGAATISRNFRSGTVPVTATYLGDHHLAPATGTFLRSTRSVGR